MSDTNAPDITPLAPPVCAETAAGHQREFLIRRLYFAVRQGRALARDAIAAAVPLAANGEAGSEVSEGTKEATSGLVAALPERWLAMLQDMLREVNEPRIRACLPPSRTAVLPRSLPYSLSCYTHTR